MFAIGEGGEDDEGRRGGHSNCPAQHQEAGSWPSVILLTNRLNEAHYRPISNL